MDDFTFGLAVGLFAGACIGLFAGACISLCVTVMLSLNKGEKDDGI